MSDIERVIPHSLGFDLAKEKVEILLKQLGKLYDLKYFWLSNESVMFRGKGGSGWGKVFEDKVFLQINLSWWAKVFKGKINDKIDEWLKEQDLL